MKRLLCLGDSITDCGRLLDSPPLGNGYVQKLSQKLTDSGRDWQITNCGVDGFTIARLLANAEPFYLPQNADIITILIGINDIGLMMNTRRTSAQQHEMLELALRHYEELLHILTRSGARFVLMEPFIFPCPAEYKTWIPHVRSLSNGIGKLAEKYRIPYVLFHDALNEKAAEQGIHTVTTDGIHLTDAGHEFLAEALFCRLNSFS